VPPPAPGRESSLPRPVVPSSAPIGAEAPVEEETTELAHLLAEIEHVPEHDRRRLALLHLEVARLMAVSGSDLGEVAERARRAADVCPELAFTHRTLRTYLAAQGRWEDVRETLDAELGVMRSPAARAALHVMRGRVVRDHLDGEQAAADLDRALALDPSSRDAVEALVAHHASRGQWEEVARALAKGAGAAKGGRALALASEAALVRDHVLGRGTEALGLYDAVLEQSPADVLAMEAVERVRGGAGRHDELVDALERQARAENRPRDAFPAWSRASTLAAERLGDTQRALGLLERAAEADPEDPGPLQALADLHRRTGDWEACEAALARRASLASTVQEASLLAAMRATLLEERLSREDDAVDVLAEALRTDPAHPTLNHMLQRLLAGRGESARRVKLAMLEAERIADASRRAAAMYVVGTSCEAAREGGLAVGAYAAALEADPAHRPAFEALRRMYEGTGQYSDLAELLESRIEATRDDAERRTLLRRLAAVREERLGDPAAATDALQRLRETPGTDGGDVATLWDLQRLHAEAGRWTEHLEALRAEADLVDDAEVRAELLWRCGVVHERRREDMTEALDAYSQALEHVPDHRPSLDALLDVAEEVGDWAGYLEHADRGLEGLDEAEKAERLVRTARFAADVVGDEQEAIQRCRRALSHVQDHPLALELLGRAYERGGQWSELAEVMERMAQAAQDPRRRAALRTRLGDLLAEHLESPEEAARVYERVVEEGTAAGGALHGLARVRMRQGNWEALAETYRRAVFLEADARARIPWLRKLAVVTGWRLGRGEAAREVLDEILAVDTEDAWAPRMSYLMSVRDGRWEDAAAALSALASSTDDERLGAALLKEEASIREVRLGEDPTERFVEAVRLAPHDREVLEALDRRAAQETRPAVVLQGWLELAIDPHERAVLLVQLGEALEEAGEETFLEPLDEALEALPGYLPAVRAARRAAGGRGDAHRAARLLQAEGDADVTCRPRARVQALFEAAETWSEELGDPESARACLDAALSVDPADERVARRLGRMLREHQRWHELADALARHAAALPEARRPPVLLERAAVLRDHLRSPGEAAITLERLLRIDRSRPEALTMLGDIYFAQGSWQKAAGAYAEAEKHLEREADPWRHARLRRVEVMAARLGKFREAETLVNDALRAAPGDREFLALLARVRRAARDYDGVEEVLESLIGSAEPDEAVELWLEAGRVALARGDARKLATSFGRAAELSLRAPGRFEPVRAFAGELPAGDAAHILKEVLYRAPSELHSASGPMRLLVAELMAADQKRSAAESEVKVALELVPEEVDAWILLARTTGDRQEAQRALFWALRLDPFRPAIYRTLAGMEETDARTVELSAGAEAVLSVMGGGGTTAGAPPRGDRRLARHQLLSWVVHPDEPAAGLELLAQGGPRLGALHPQPDHGPLTSISRNNEVSLLVDQVARVFGVERYELAATNRTAVGAVFVVEERPTVIVGEHLLDGRERELRFHLGRVFALLSSGGALVHVLPAEQSEALVEALAGQHVSGMGDAQLVQRVGKTLGWMGRRALAGAARTYAASPADATAWRRATALTAVRGGLVACTDVAAARRALHEMAGIPVPAAGSKDAWEVSRTVPLLGELLSYAVSAEYAAARDHVTDSGR
jgi:tetratricopeptide (TPR) repeat protein